MNKTIFITIFLFLLITLNYLIYEKENTLKNGEKILLELALVDPRSLIQGDYMQLRYKTLENVDAINEKPKGKVVMNFDENRVAHFSHFDSGSPLKEDECYLVYRKVIKRHGRHPIRLGAEAFFFQEGHAHHYENAKYGELAVDSKGNSVLVGLRDNNFKRINPQ